MVILCSAKMGPGTFEAKFNPLSQLEEIDSIYILRKEKGPDIDKVRYILLPGICKFPVINLILTPLLLVYYSFRLKADVILAYHVIPHGIFAYLGHLFTGKPYIIGQTGLDIQTLVNRKFFGPMLLSVLKKARFFNVPGEKSRTYWLSKGLNSARVKTLHSSINTEVFKPDNSEKKYDFIFVGRLTEVKRIDYIIRSFAECHKYNPDAKLAIVGQGTLEAELKELAGQLALQTSVAFLGFQRETYKYLNQSRFLVMASVSEGLPCAMMEAMACGVICISNPVGNIPDLIKPGNTGFLYEYGENSLSEVMKKLYNREDLTQVAANSRKAIVENHSYQCVKELWKQELWHLNK